MSERKRRARDVAEQHAQAQTLNAEQRRIAGWLKKLRFKRQLIGGVSERDVWKRLDELNSLYDQALHAERARYDALLEMQSSQANASISRGEADERS